MANNDQGKDVKFVCPECGETKLECCMDGPHVCSVTNIHSSGDFEYGDFTSQACCDHWQCATCAFTISDSCDEPILDNQEVAEWCLENCSQE